MEYTSPVLNKYEQIGDSWSPAVRVAILAAIVNASIYGMAVATGVFTSFSIQPLVGGEPTIGLVLIASFALPLLAFSAYRALHRRYGISYRVFLGSGSLVILASLLLPTILTAWSFTQVLAAQAMHVVVGVAALYGVSVWANVSAERR